MALGEAHVISTTKQQLTDAASMPSRSRGPPLRAVRRARVASSEASASYSSRTCRTKLKRTSSENSVKSLAGWRISSCRIRTPSPSSSFWRLPKPGVRSRGSPTSVTVTYLSTSSGLRKIFSIQARRRSTSRAPRRWRRRAASDLAKEAREKTKAKVDAASDLAGKTADEDATSIFVKGLDFGTVEKKLRAHFVAAAEESRDEFSRRCRHHRGPGGKLLSRGFGFVEFDQHIVAKSVLNALQGSSLDGKTLKLELSSQGGARGRRVSNKVPRASARRSSSFETSPSKRRNETFKSFSILLVS